MQPQDVSILIADDHKMVRTGLRLMLSLQSGYYNFLVSEAKNGEEAISKSIKNDYDVILLDYNMPGFKGDDVVSRILVHKPGAKIMMLSNFNEKSFVSSCVNNGAKSYLLKDVETDELVKAIETVKQGKTYFSEEIAEKLYSEDGQTVTSQSFRTKLGLSKRQIEILRLLSSEMTNDEIAKKLGLSKRTVDTHRQNLLQKLSAKNTVGLIKFAIHNNIAS
jgi:DNA-binding NarL/FixJ family response regulator